jgi:hypothetical protein
MEPTNTADEPDARGAGSDSLSQIVDWITAALCGLAGLFFAAVGLGLYSVADRDTVTEFVVDENIHIDELTQEETVDLLVAILKWGGLGTVLLGILLVAGGVAFLVYRRRQDRPAQASQDTITLSIVGGVVTIVVSAIPFSPILGGLVSSYLRKGTTAEGTKIGAFAGVVASLPIIALGVLILVVFAAVAVELSLGLGAVAGGFAILFGLLVGLAYTIGLSALGGFLGAKLAGRETDSPE